MAKTHNPAVHPTLRFKFSKCLILVKHTLCELCWKLLTSQDSGWADIFFGYRLNEGNVRVHTMDRIDALLRKAVGMRLRYADLISA